MPIFMPVPSGSALAPFPFDGRQEAGIQILPVFDARNSERQVLAFARSLLGSLRLSAHGLDLLLQPFPRLVVQAGELNAHAYSAVTRANHRCSPDSFRIQPKCNAQDLAYGKGQHGLHITAASAYVC